MFHLGAKCPKNLDPKIDGLDDLFPVDGKFSFIFDLPLFQHTFHRKKTVPPVTHCSKVFMSIIFELSACSVEVPCTAFAACGFGAGVILCPASGKAVSEGSLRKALAPPHTGQEEHRHHVWGGGGHLPRDPARAIARALVAVFNFKRR